MFEKHPINAISPRILAAYDILTSMIGQNYVKHIERIITDFDPHRLNRYFLFGSSVRRDRFGDVDLGVVGNRASRRELGALRDRLYESTLPYSVDVVDFDTARRSFVDYVLHEEPLVWLNS